MNTFGWGGGWYKKTRGVIGYEKMHFCYYLSDSEGSRTKAQRLGGVVGERIGRGMVWDCTFGLGGGLYKKTQGGHWI